jgi:hypothetical protein
VLRITASYSHDHVIRHIAELLLKIYNFCFAAETNHNEERLLTIQRSENNILLLINS